MARVSRPSVDLTALAHELGKGRDALLNDALTETIKLCPAPNVPVDPKRDNAINDKRINGTLPFIQC